MKGLILKEFLKKVESDYGYETVDKMIVNSKIKSDGAYTSIGYYPYQELLCLVSQLVELKRIPAQNVVLSFGKYLLQLFIQLRPEYFTGKGTFALLASIQSLIHEDVKKLYPGAELPQFLLEKVSAQQMIIHYQSSRPFADLAEGLIVATIEYYKESISFKSEDTSYGKNTSRRFILTRSD